jgi:tetratricopeptide (TPR) repeat protein
LTIYKMILTQCAVCATELGLSLGKKCGRCSTRYCGPECQVQHWKEGGHDKLCKLIKKAGGAEQYNANQKYAEAVSVAVEKCTDDTKGQTCYICTQALHWKTKEGLVRGCACRGTAGFAHVSCLAEQAKILREDAVANNKDSQWHRWYKCGLCEQEYHGVVSCALGWACWKTYVGRPETDGLRINAMKRLGNGLFDAGQHADSLSVREAEMALMWRVGASGDSILAVQGNLAMTYTALGRLEDSRRVQQDIYSGHVRLHGEEHNRTITAALNYSLSLTGLERFEEAKPLLRKTIPVARRVLGENHDLTLRMSLSYAISLYLDAKATLEDLREAVSTLEEAEQTARRVLGGAHPVTAGTEGELRDARAALRAREEALARVGGVAIFAAVALAAAAAVLVLRKKLT